VESQKSKFKSLKEGNFSITEYLTRRTRRTRRCTQSL